MRISRRPVTESDRDFLFALYASTRAAEMAVVPWNEEQKRAFVESQFLAQSRGYQEAYPQATHEILSRDGVDVGRLYLARGANHIHILDITVAPEARNAGIGSSVLGEILAEADRSGWPVSIYVESFNPSRRWLDRLGFRVVSEDGFMLFLCHSASEPDRREAAEQASG